VGTENDIRGVRPFLLLSVVVNNRKVYRWCAVELDSGAVQALGGYNSFLMALVSMDELALSAHFEMDSRRKLMGSRN
jgi:hypothetical protein